MAHNIYLKIAEKAAYAAGRIIKKNFSGGFNVQYKGRINPVTDVDKLSQETIRKIIKKEFPGHSFLAEEKGAEERAGEYNWVVDPLDGTVNFIHGLPIVSVSIALLRKGKPLCGVVHAPLLNETFTAVKGGGAKFNGKRMRVSGINDPVRAMAVTGFSYKIHENAKRDFAKLIQISRRVQGIRRLGSAALDLAYVAAGRFEFFWEEGLAPWDVAAGSLIVSEAGGKVTAIRVKGDHIFGGSLLASNGKLHAVVLKELRKKIAREVR